MPDINKINTDYYGTKDEWGRAPTTSDLDFKIPKWNNITNAYSNGTLVLNERLESSMNLFGIKGKSDFLYPCGMVYDRVNGYTLFSEKKETTEIGYFYTKYPYDYRYESLDWSNSIQNTESNNRINGTGLAYPVSKKIFECVLPILDFDYTSICSLITLKLIKQNSNNTTTIIDDVTAGDFFNSAEYADYEICGYYHYIYGGQTGNRKFSRLYAITGTNFPKNSLNNYEIFSYQPFTCLFGGGVYESISFNLGNNNERSMYFFANPNYWRIKEFKNNNKSVFYPIFTGSFDDLLMLSSYIGICFTPYADSVNSEIGQNMSDRNLYAPVIEDGVLTGKYKRGSEAGKLPQMTWTNDIREKTGYKGIDSIDPTEYTDKISLSVPKIKSEGKFNTLYAMTDNEINSLSDELWGADENKLKQIMNGLMLMGENPLNCIVSLQLFPFDITSMAGTSTQGSITLGATQMNTTGSKVKNLNSVIDIGSVKLRPHFNNFFDYEPYSTAFIYVPYCGTIQLSLNDVIGKIVSVKLLIDYISGVCTAVVFADGIPVIYKNGCISQQIAVTGNDMATMSSNAISSSLGILTNTTNLIAGGKDVSSVINNSANLLSSSFDYSAKRTIYQTQGANTSQINMCEPQKAYIVLNLPKFDIADEYSAFHGFRCDFYDTVKNLSGYVETDRPNLTGISATEEEKQMLSEIMTGGFYV